LGGNLDPLLKSNKSKECFILDYSYSKQFEYFDIKNISSADMMREDVLLRYNSRNLQTNPL